MKIIKVFKSLDVLKLSKFQIWINIMKSFNEIFFNQYYKDNKFIQYKNDDENIFNILYEKLKIDLNEEMLKKEKEDKLEKKKLKIN